MRNFSRHRFARTTTLALASTSGRLWVARVVVQNAFVALLVALLWLVPSATPAHALFGSIHVTSLAPPYLR